MSTHYWLHAHMHTHKSSPPQVHCTSISIIMMYTAPTDVESLLHLPPAMLHVYKVMLLIRFENCFHTQAVGTSYLGRTCHAASK